jgi:hypothetical protein
MAFESLSRPLRGATDILGGLADEVGNGRANHEEDVRKVRRAFGALGRMEEPEDEPSGFIDRPLDTAIQGFQRDKGLRVDGFMRPAGPTERSLRHDALGALREENDRSGRDRDNGLNGSRPRSLFPAPSLLGKRISGFGRFDLDRDHDDRGDSFALLDLAERPPSSGRTTDFRPGLDARQSRERRSREGRDRFASSDVDSRPERAVGMQRLTAPAVRPTPEELEPARLKPALDQIESNLRRTVEGWRERGMTDAAHHLEHFLEGSGEGITYNREQARSFWPVRNAEEDAKKLIREEILERARTLKDGEALKDVAFEVRGQQGLIRHGFDLLRGLFGDTDRFNDNLATGRTTIRSIFKGTISRKGNEVSVDGTVDHDWRDSYDFHPSRFGLPQPGAAAAKSLEQYRGAKAYRFGGSWRQSLSGGIGRGGPSLRFVDLD